MEPEIDLEIDLNNLIFIATYLEQMRKTYPGSLPPDVQDDLDNFVAAVRVRNPGKFE
jgi:uncharacterized short protein YbdD (DUF466 family)